MDENTKDILEAVNFIKDRMATKVDIADLRAELKSDIAKLDNRLMAIESKVGGTHNRINDEAAQRNNLESRVRSVLPNFPPRPERV